jgi:phage terminase large subunit
VAKKELLYEISGAAAELFGCYWQEVLIEGPAGTGKTRAVCERAHYFARTFPGCRILFVRKTRVSMTQTVLVTWERDTLPERHPCISGGAGRANRTTYVYPNGSEIVVGGMDNPDRIMSSEYDLICFFEATEMTLEDFEKASTRLRNHMIPHPESKHPEEVKDSKGEPQIALIRSEFAEGKYPSGIYPNGDPLFLEQIICDCNPGPEWHWLNRRPERKISSGARRGQPVMKRLLSKHEDNPTVTRKYLDVLDNLTGPRRARLRDGKWVTAEGLIWENFDPHRHVIDGDLTQQWNTKRWRLYVPSWGAESIDLTWFAAGVDWGFRAPGVIQVWGMDKKQRAFLVYEIMRTQKDKMWWAEVAEELRKKYDIQRFACDPAEPATIELFNNRMGKVGGYWICEGAENDFPAGADVVRQRLSRGKMYILRNSPDGMDTFLMENQKPLSLAEEITGYSYERSKDGAPIRERPAKDSDDHGCDAARYLSMFLEKADWQPEKDMAYYAPGTYGAVMGHNEVMDELLYGI